MWSKFFKIEPITIDKVITWMLTLAAMGISLGFSIGDQKIAEPDIKIYDLSISYLFLPRRITIESNIIEPYTPVCIIKFDLGNDGGDSTAIMDYAVSLESYDRTITVDKTGTQRILLPDNEIPGETLIYAWQTTSNIHFAEPILLEKTYNLEEKSQTIYFTITYPKIDYSNIGGKFDEIRSLDGTIRIKFILRLLRGQEVSTEYLQCPYPDNNFQYCGDTVCNEIETCITCPGDCESCP